MAAYASSAPMASPTATTAGPQAAREAGRRRTFAIISHPDAGKTTLTEKLLLYAGAVTQAGAVDARKGGRQATSDWMSVERERGISVTSTVMRFEVGDVVYNLLDTPGHRDFSEDTLRVLAAADSAIMVLDGARGVEPQTLRLFQVARARGIPLITLVNKYDRPGREPLELVDHIRETLGLEPTPVTWPVGEPGDFRGVIDRRDGTYSRFQRTAHGATRADRTVLSAEEAAAAEGEAWTTASEEIELLEAVGADHDQELFLAGESTPVFFGSAMWNFGVEAVLQAVRDMAPAPTAAPDDPDGTAGEGDPEEIRLRALDEPFSAQVFKVQAGSNPRHRDRVAFMRVRSGRFDRGMRAVNAQSGKPFALTHAHAVFGRERSGVDEAWPGDVIGVAGASELNVGDTLFDGDGAPVAYAPIPTLAPERFAVASQRASDRSKQFRRGLSQLDEEGVVHLLARARTGDPRPILGGLGQLQFEVAQHRMQEEFGVRLELEPLPYEVARRTDEDGAATVERTGGEVYTATDGTLLAVWVNVYRLERFERENPDVLLERIVATRAVRPDAA